MAEIRTLPRKAAALPDSEKITVNLGFVDLGQVDLLVKEGFYSNRSDFIRTAIRQQLLHHGDIVRQTMSRQTLTLGLQRFSRADLERVQRAGQTLDVRVVGLASIASDVSADLARATIDSLMVLGSLQASPEVLAALDDRMR